MNTHRPIDPRVTGQTANVGHPAPRCAAVEPESGEPCRLNVGHGGAHECWCRVEWTEEGAS